MTPLSVDLPRLERALEALHGPFDRSDADAWRREANRVRAILAGRPPLGTARVLATLEPRFVEPVPDAQLARRHGLRPREIQVARRMAAGRTNAGIAADLGISPHTVKRHVERVLERVGVSSRAEVAARLHRPPGAG